MKPNHYKKLSVVLMCGMLTSALSLTPVYADETEDPAPVVRFQHCAIRFVEDKTGPDGYPYRYLDNDLFYIEYPGSWLFGTNDICPIVFYDDSEVEKITHDFETFQDSALIGPEDQIDQYIQAGGLNPYFQQVLHISDPTGYRFDVQEKENLMLVYSLKKDRDTVASIIVWTSFGQLMIRDERSEINLDPVRDYGSIMVMPVQDSEDFSSLEAIQAYVDSGKLTSCLGLDSGAPTWSTAPFQTENHTYLLCEGSGDSLNIAVYIPITPSEMKNWMVGFNACRESEISYNAYRIREDIIRTFKVLK